MSDNESKGATIWIGGKLIGKVKSFEVRTTPIPEPVYELKTRPPLPTDEEQLKYYIGALMQTDLKDEEPHE